MDILSVWVIHHIARQR